ncbi:MAG: DUF2963 domain-containing protein [Vigna little leaf phytoplasma]|nr:DUF2963 domain-containing protein [Vigna little leaf phytoplasma]
MIIKSWTKDYYSKIFFTINVVLTCLILIISIFLYRYIQVKNTIIEDNKKLKSQINNLILELKSYKYKNDETNITKFTEENGNLIQKNYHNDKKTLNYIREFDKKDINKIIKQTQYQADGKTINFIYEYDKDNGQIMKQTQYQADGKNIIFINEYEYDKDNGQIMKQTQYQADGKTINFINEYDKDNGQIIKKTQYKDDGKSVDFINEYDKDNGVMIKQHYFTGYGSENIIISQKEFDKITGKMIKLILYFKDNPNIINLINEYDKDTGEIIKKTEYHDGIKIKDIELYNKNGQLIKMIKYCKNNGLVERILEKVQKDDVNYDPNKPFKLIYLIDNDVSCEKS